MVAKAKDKSLLKASFTIPAVWRGRSRSEATGGVHAVGTMLNGFNEGARKAACGLVGRFFVDERLTAGVSHWRDVPMKERCPKCHEALLGESKSPTEPSIK